MPRSSRTVVTRIRPIQRTFFFRASSTRYAPTATVEKVIENSYMLPQGARCTDIARATTPAASTRKASAVSETAIRPYRSPCTVPPAAPGPSGTSRVPAAERVTTFGLSRTAVLPPLPRTCTAGAAAPASLAPVSAAAVRATLLRLPKVHSAMCAKKASV